MLDTARAEIEREMEVLKAKCKVPLENLKSEPPSLQQALARANKLTHVATVDGVWPVTKVATPGNPTPSTSMSAQSAGNHG